MGFFIEDELKVFSSNGDFNDLFKDMDENIILKNIRNVKNKFSDEKLKEDLYKIFSYWMEISTSKNLFIVAGEIYENTIHYWVQRIYRN